MIALMDMDQGEKDPCYAYVAVDPVTGEEDFFTISDPNGGQWNGLKVAAPSGFDIQSNVDSANLARRIPYPNSLEFAIEMKLPSNNPKTYHSAYQHAGNLNYGAVGYVYGIGLNELSQAAGYLQAGSPANAGEPPSVFPTPIWNSRGFPGSLIDVDWFKGGTPPYYGNEPFDHNVAEDGYNAAKAGKRIEKREVPCDEVGM